MWTILYAMMGISLWLFLETRSGPSRRWVLSLFFAQLALNAAWSPVFFGLHAIQAGLLIIVTLAVMVAITIYLGLAINRGAALLLVPYMLWVLPQCSTAGSSRLISEAAVRLWSLRRGFAQHHGDGAPAPLLPPRPWMSFGQRHTHEQEKN